MKMLLIFTASLLMSQSLYANTCNEKFTSLMEQNERNAFLDTMASDLKSRLSRGHIRSEGAHSAQERVALLQKHRTEAFNKAADLNETIKKECLI